MVTVMLLRYDRGDGVLAPRRRSAPTGAGPAQAVLSFLEGHSAPCGPDGPVTTATTRALSTSNSTTFPFRIASPRCQSDGRARSRDRQRPETGTSRMGPRQVRRTRAPGWSIPAGWTASGPCRCPGRPASHGSCRRPHDQSRCPSNEHLPIKPGWLRHVVLTRSIYTERRRSTMSPP